MKHVWVRWVDSANLFGDRWAKLEEIDDLETYCETLGFLVKENDHSIYVAGSIAPEEVGSVMQIPKVAVKELKEVGDGEVDVQAEEEASFLDLCRPESLLPGAGQESRCQCEGSCVSGC
jgi:hypothetical protein